MARATQGTEAPAGLAHVVERNIQTLLKQRQEQERDLPYRPSCSFSRNRMAALADRRADLDLHISLVAEHEISRVIALVTSRAERMGIERARDPELEELARDVEPHQVMDRIEEQTEGPGEKG